MRTQFWTGTVALGALSAMLFAGCAGGGGATKDDGTAKKTSGPRRGKRAGGRLPDPLPAGVDIIPEDQMTPSQLVDQLASLDAAARDRAHDRLLRLGANAVSELLAGLKRQEEHIRAQSAHVLGLLGEPGSGAAIVYAVIAMVEAAEDSGYARSLGLWALGRLRLHSHGSARDKAGRTAFFYLNDPSPGVRSHAAETIRRQGYRPAVARLIGMLDTRNEGATRNPLHRQYIRDALKDITFEDFGLDAQKWADWWALNADRVFGA